MFSFRKSQAQNAATLRQEGAPAFWQVILDEVPICY
jgi:hypothetical protein